MHIYPDVIEHPVGIESAQDFFKRVAWIFEDGAPPPEPPGATPTEQALGLWNGAKHPPQFEAPRAFFASREFVLDDDLAMSVLRWHPILGALLGLFRDIRTDEPCAVGQIYIKRDGRVRGRQFLGPVEGAAIKLDFNEAVTTSLFVGQSLEACLAARQAGLRPCWALGSSQNIAEFPLLAGVESLSILREHDAASAKAANKCGTRWAAAGRKVFDVWPSAVKDEGGQTMKAFDEAVTITPFEPSLEPPPEPPTEPSPPGSERFGPSIGESITQPQTPDLEIFDVGDEDGRIAPRQWLLGTVFCREFLSGLIGAGAGGKTTVRILQYLSAATTRELSGEHVFVQCRIMIVCLEDNMMELRRRVRAAMLHHGIKPEDVKGRLFLTTPRQLKIAQYGGAHGTTVVPGGLYYALAAKIDSLKLDIVSIDPAIKAHALKENMNEDMDAFATLLADLATKKNIGIDLLSHERKGLGEAGDVNRSRGASSYKDALRIGHTLTGMSENEAQSLGVSEADRKLLLRIDGAKVNIAPPTFVAQWFKLVGVPINNGNDVYPNGDIVQAVERWEPPSGTWKDLDVRTLNIILDSIDEGMADGERYSDDGAARTRAAWKAVKIHTPDKTEVQCKDIIKQWVKNSLLVRENYRSSDRKIRTGLRVNNVKRPGTETDGWQ